MGHPHTLVLASSFTIAHPRAVTKMPTILLAALFAYALSKFTFKWIQIVYESLTSDTTSIRLKMDKKTSASNDFYTISYVHDNVSREKTIRTIRYVSIIFTIDFCKFLNSLSNERERGWRGASFGERRKHRWLPIPRLSSRKRRTQRA